MKKFVKILIIIILILITIYKISTFVPQKFQLYINKKYKSDLSKYIEELYPHPEKITKIKIKPQLGDGYIYLYSGFHLVKEVLVSEENEIYTYVLEHDSDNNNLGIFYIILKLLIFISLIVLAICVFIIIIKKVLKI